MKVSLNGAPHEVAAQAKVADAVALVTAAATGVAVALNGEVVPRGQWPTTPLHEEDKLEILTASQGG